MDRWGGLKLTGGEREEESKVVGCMIGRNKLESYRSKMQGLGNQNKVMISTEKELYLDFGSIHGVQGWSISKNKMDWPLVRRAVVQSSSTVYCFRLQQ